MRKKDLIFYVIFLIILALFLWQWISKGTLINQANQLQQLLGKQKSYVSQLQILSGIGVLGSTHIHADIKIYINGQSIDFSQKKYQVTTSYIHFEDGLGDVIHVHATGMTIGNLLNSVGINLNNGCLVFGGQGYCNDKNKKLKFYVNGKLTNEPNSYIINDLDKYLISYGNENDAEIQKQLDSITNLAPKYSHSVME